MKFFPLFIPTSGKRVLIIGGGNIAFRRVQTLLKFDCRIHIIAENLCSRLEAFVSVYSERLRIERRIFSSGDISAEGSCKPIFVVAATDKREVNHAVAMECAAHDIPVSVADCKEESTFYFPAIAIHDTIIAGISSGGNDHAAVRDAAAIIREALGKK
jgi:precorrin-2 dehydrogenase/sirohydrochlorin ferrochelatase/precorrin-6A/cobalt-precorrin-6A reductase